MLGKEAVKAIRGKYPGFDHSLWSKAMRPDYYGVKLVAGAAALVTDTAPRKADKRSKANKYTWRAGNALKSRLQTAKKAKGILTDQEAITIAVLEWVERSENNV